MLGASDQILETAELRWKSNLFDGLDRGGIKREWVAKIVHEELPLETDNERHSILLESLTKSWCESKFEHSTDDYHRVKESLSRLAWSVLFSAKETYPRFASRKVGR